MKERKEKNVLLLSISNWFKRTFSDPAAVTLFLVLVFGVLFIELFGKLIAPILVAVVIAYLLQSPIKLLKRWRWPHLAAVITVYILFLSLVIYAIVGLIPLFWKELVNLINNLPHAFDQGKNWLNEIILRYPKIFSQAQLHHVIDYVQSQSVKVGQVVLHYSLASIGNVIQVILYVVLVPLLVFFFLKDQQVIMRWFGRYMPANRILVQKVWNEVNIKIGAYVKGRVVEIFIVGTINFLVFALFDLQYAFLLAALVGLSVIVPYFGAVIVTVPVIGVALMQWGLSTKFVGLIITYAVVMIIDANVIGPLLFSEVMELHPVVIILAIVIFGGIWGFWGVFFAIPLATLVQAVLRAWPRVPRES